MSNGDIHKPFAGIAPPIAIRSDADYEREEAERRRRRRNDGGLGRCDEWGCDREATVRAGVCHWTCAECAPRATP